MKKYKFTIKKELKNNVEIVAKNKRLALIKIIEMLGLGDNFIFENSKKDEQFYEIKLNEIIDCDNKKMDKKSNYNKQKIEKILKEIEQKNDKKIEETEDDFPIEYNEIVCEKCGNCIMLD